MNREMGKTFDETSWVSERGGDAEEAGFMESG